MDQEQQKSKPHNARKSLAAIFIHHGTTKANEGTMIARAASVRGVNAT